MIDMKPKDVIKLDIVELYKSETFNKKIITEDSYYRYLYQHGEHDGDKIRRVTYLFWSNDIYRMDRIVDNLGKHVLYYF